MRYFLIATLVIFAFTGNAEARRHHHRHHVHKNNSKVIAKPEENKPKVIAESDPRFALPQAVKPESGPITVIDGCGGMRLKVASEYAIQFQGFFCALAEAGHYLRSDDTACQSSGHMSGSKHNWGGACDILQTARNKTADFMYHISELAHKWGLKDGCEFATNKHERWTGPDCGHIEVPGSNGSASSAHFALYQSARQHTRVASSERRRHRHKRSRQYAQISLAVPSPTHY